MSLVSVDRLTRDLLLAYRNEDEVGLLVNSKEREIYIIGKDTYHAAVALEVLETTKSEIRRNPYLSSHLVSSHIVLDGKYVEQVITGLGSLEKNLGVGHTQRQLNLAHRLAVAFVDEGNIQKSDTFQARIACPHILRPKSRQKQ